MGLYIDLDKARELIAMAVEERGHDYTYTPALGSGCTYVHVTGFNKEPGCGVGLALIRGGVSIQSFLDLGINVGTGAHAALSKLESSGVIDGFTHDGYLYLASFQEAQDSGDRWGEAKAVAEQSVKYL